MCTVVPSRFFLSSRPVNRLAVRLVGSLGDDALVNQVDVAPVLALSTLTINLGSRVGDCSPESATRDIFAPSVALGIEEGLAGLQGELGLLGDVGGLTADGRVDVVGIGTGGSEVVDVRVEDDVGGCVVEGSPVAGAQEAVLDHHGDALVLQSHISTSAGVVWMG
jgi:hypothetical protein